MSSIMLIVPIFFPMLAALFTLVIKDQFSDRSFREKYVSAVLIINLALLLIALKGGGSLVLLKLTDFLPVLLRVDNLTWLFTLLVSVMWLLAGIFSLEYMKHEEKKDTD